MQVIPFGADKMDSERNLFVRPSGSSRRPSTSGYNNRNFSKNKHRYTGDRVGDSSSDCGQYQENSYVEKQFRGGYMSGSDTIKYRGKVLDHNKRYPGQHQAKVKRNFVAPITGTMPKNYDIDCKYYICPICKLQYNYYKNRNILCGRLPRVLTCGHTVCEDCINKSVKLTNFTRCIICLQLTMKKKQDLDYNYFVIGHLICSRMNQNSAIDFSDVSLMSTGVKLQGSSNDLKMPNNLEVICGLGACSNAAKVRCIDCCDEYCEKCDVAVHTSGKHLLAHRRKNIEKVDYELKKCSDHMMYEDLHCATCEEDCCCYCMLEKHEGHTRIYLVRLDNNEEKQLKNSYKLASKRLQELQQSQNQIEKPDRDKVSDVEIEIARCFTDIHAELFQIEKKLRLKAKEQSNRNAVLNEIDYVITSNIETIKYLLMCVDRRSEMKLNLKGLLRKLKEMEKIPSVLVIDDASGETGARLVIDEKLKQLESYFILETPEKGLYKLVTADELPENEIEHGMDPQDYDVKKLEDFKKPSQNEASTSFTKTAKQENLKPSYKNEFDQQTVYITHMHSLNCFYVQFKKEDKQFKQLMKEINNHMENRPENVVDVDINELYMTPCLANKNEWGRVRVLEEINVDSYIKYKVKFIDFGNEKVVDKSELKHISSSLANRKPFAVQCKLDNLSQIPWTKNSHLQLANLLGINQEVIMFTKEFSNNIYTVDLHIITSCGDLRSVSDLLIFGYGALQTDSKSLDLLAESKQLFSNSDVFVIGESHYVYLRYVVDPWNIYIQKTCYENSLSSLLSSMETFYHTSKCDIHLPFKGSDVVIFYPNNLYGDWHRARILEVFSDKKTVTVFLLDWGKKVHVPWQNLRNLVELFRTTECLVVKVKLADVHPHGGDWSHFNSSGGKNFFEKYYKKNKSLKMLVSESVLLEVVLFENHQTYDTNINALFVEQGFGYSTGKLSETVNWLHKTEEEKMDENEYLPIYKNFIDDEDDDSEEELEGVKSPVEIVQFENPHSINVSFLLMKAESKQLREELQIHYVEKKGEVQMSWKLTDKVVVFDPVEKEYYRGRIEMINQDLYDVYLLDRGDQIRVTEKELRSISPYFSSKFPNMVIKCHLANIKPAGDSTKWSFMSIEWFQKLFQEHKQFYIRKVSDDKEKSSLPVTMWYSKVQQGTALEPSVRKFISVEKKLVKAGLAFYVINEKSQKVVSKVITSSLKESSSPTAISKNMEGNEDGDAIPCLEDYPENSSPPITLAHTQFQEDDVDIEYDIKEWLRPKCIEKKEFNAYITCAENGGYLFVRDEDLHSSYKEMEKNIKLHFDSIPKAKPFILHENQLVTVWSCDFWYRGVILSVIDKNTAKIMMVDFGSDHIVKREHLHNKIMYPEIPIMVSKIKLYNVHSKSLMWSDIDVDIFLNTVSEYSRIVIRSSLKVDIPSAEIYDEDGVCLNDKLVKLCPNLYRKRFEAIEVKTSISSSDEEPEHLETINPVNNSSTITSETVTWNSMVEDELEEMRRKNMEYRYVRLPYSLPGEKILMDITSVFDYRTVSLYIGNDESKEKFAVLSKSLQEEAPGLEYLKDWKVGMPCISLFDDDNLWYRAKIIQIDQLSCGYVTVIYVDYGNFEIVKATDLKPLKPEWLNFPAAFFVAKMNYRVLEPKNECYLLKHTQELVGKSKFVEILSDKPLTIHIYDEEDGELYYHMFLKNGVIELEEQDTM